MPDTSLKCLPECLAVCTKNKLSIVLGPPLFLSVKLVTTMQTHEAHYKVMTTLFRQETINFQVRSCFTESSFALSRTLILSSLLNKSDVKTCHCHGMVHHRSSLSLSLGLWPCPSCRRSSKTGKV